MESALQSKILEPSVTKDDKKRLIIVLGMHRSGTSVITRGLKVMGVQLGNNLMPPVKDVNEKGFWEDNDFNNLNIEILNTLNHDWHYLASIDQEKIEELTRNGYLEKAIELIQQKTQGYSIFGLKDPRTAKLLPFWKEVFVKCQYEVSYVITIRHPKSVAQSLAKRDGFDFEKSYLLWLGHIINILAHTIGNNYVVVDYDTLMQSPEAELQRVASALHLTMDNKELEIFKSEFLDDKLRHSSYGLDDLTREKSINGMIREVYENVMDLSSEKPIDNNLLKVKINKWGNELERLNYTSVLADKLSEKITRLKLQNQDKDIVIVKQNEELNREKEKLRQLYSSKSWRITKPLRSLMGLLKKD